MDGLTELRANIAHYVKRFYLERIIAGSLITTGVAGLLWLVFVVLEYNLHLGTLTRGVMFFGFLFVTLGLITIQIVLPALRMSGFLPATPEDAAARAISKRVPELDDRLINVLNLQKLGQGEFNALVAASLRQQAGVLNRYNFREAIDLRKTLTWLKLTLSPLALFLLIALYNPAVLTEGSARLVRYQESFVPPAPFHLHLINDDLTVAEGDDITIRIEAAGTSLPSNAFIQLGSNEFRMKPEQGGVFTYEIKNVRQNIDFKVRATSIYSEAHQVVALARPKLIEQIAYLDYPRHTGLKNERAMNKTQIMIPEGTNVTWGLTAKDANPPSLKSSSGVQPLQEQGNNYSISRRFLTGDRVVFILDNDQGMSDSSAVTIQVVKDAHPQIQVDEALDSLSYQHYFQGRLEDDYGLTKLHFVVQREGKTLLREPIALTNNLSKQGFAFAWTPDSLNLEEGESLDLFFEVWDNDGVNGPKKSQSRIWKFEQPTAEELQAEREKVNDQTKKSLDAQSKELKDMDKMLDELRKDLMEKKRPDWEEKEALKEILEKQKEMMQEVEKKAEKQQKQLEKSQRYNQYSEELLQKQERIQEMFEELFDEEFKQMYEEYNELLEELNKEEMLKKMEEMKLSNEQLEKELDRTLELFKRLEFEQKLEENLNRLEELNEEQEELNNETQERGADSEELSEKQEELQEKLDQLSKEMDKMEKLNEGLEEPESLPETSQEEQDAQQNMEDAKDQLQKGNQKKAGEPQKKAKEDLEKMQEKLSGFQQQMMQSQNSENLDDMRQLLENIVDLSQGQERVMEDIKSIDQSDPMYVKLSKTQKELIDDSKIIEDSLLALSKRVPMLDKMINDEISDVKFNMSKSLEYLSNQPPRQEDRYKAMAVERQQYAMTSLNNLALLFDELIQQAQQQMQSSMKGSGQCNKPGSTGQGKPSAAEMRKMQQNLNKKIEQLKQAMEEGKNPNGKKPGQTKGSGLGGMSKEMAQMAAEQAALRKQLRQMSESMKEGGNKGSGSLGEAQEMMEQTEEDILFGNITAETIRRQQEILNRLLESEKAEREREKDPKRESRTNQTAFDIPDEVWDEYQKEREKELELYKTVPPNLKPFYRNEVNRYFSNLR